MPRLSNKDYWKYHKTLRRLWLEHQSIYAELSPRRQWDLHDFFQPSKDLTKEELVAHRKAISKERPGLAHQAGWALKQLNQALAAPARVYSGKKTNRVRVRSVVRPEIDYEKLTLALMRIAKRKKWIDGESEDVQCDEIT